MRIALATIGARGDIEPALALACVLHARGHVVTFVGPTEYVGQIEQAGLVSHPLAPAIAELATPDEKEPLWRRGRKFFAARKHVIRQFDRVLEAAADTDLLLASISFAPAALTARDRFGVKTCLFNVAVPFVRTGAWPNPWLPPLRLGRTGNRLSYVVFEELLWQTVRAPVNRWRRERWNLPGFPVFGFFRRIYDERVPLLIGMSRHVYPRADDYPPSVHVTGRWFLPESAEYTAPPEVEAFLRAGPPPIAITFGSNPIADADRVLTVVLGALETTGKRGILIGATSELGRGANLGDRAIHVDTIPFGWLFPRVELVIHHGGAGSSACCLQTGVPSIVLPTRPDQLAFGRRLAQLGLAPPPLPLRSVTRESLVAALQSVGASDAAGRARRMAENIRSEPGVDEAADLALSHARGTSVG